MTSNTTIDHATTATITASVAMPTVTLAGIDTQPSSITYSVSPLQRLGLGRRRAARPNDLRAQPHHP